MAGVSKVINQHIRRGVFLALLVFLLTTGTVFASPNAPTIGETDWRTGELEIAWSGVVPGNTIKLYVYTEKNPNWRVLDSWIADAATGSRVIKPFENGQTVWHYITQTDPAGIESPDSPTAKQTPPITAFIINWPDMFKDINGKLDQLYTPSDAAMNGLRDSINGLKDALGAGAADQAGNDLKSGMDGLQGGMKAPIVNDDGNGTYTGGSGGLTLPNSKSTDSLGLKVPNLDEGTDTELTMRIPIGVKMDGSLLYIKLFTKEQMDKMKWLGLLRTLAAATLWILFAFWIVQRFTPQMKV